MSEDYIKREEYNASIGRVHDKVDEVGKSVIRIEESSKHIEKFTQDIHKLLYGNGNNGFITKVDKKFTQLFERVGLHSKILVGSLLLSSLGAIIFAFWRFIFK